MSDQGEKIAKSFGGLGFYRGCSIIFAPLDKTSATINSLSGSPVNDKLDLLEQNHYQHNNHHHQASNHLLELQKEIKEEEEEIFADINSLINSRSNLYFAFDDDDDEDADDGVNLDDDENPSAFYRAGLNANSSANCSNSSSSNNNVNSISSGENNNIALNSNPVNNAALATSLLSRNQYPTNGALDDRLFANDSEDLNDIHSIADLTTTTSFTHDDDELDEHQQYQHQRQQQQHHLSTGGGLTNSEDHNHHLDYHHDFYQVDAAEQEQAAGFMLQEDSNNRYLQSQKEDEDSTAKANESQYMDENAFVEYNEEDDHQTNYQALQAVIQQVQSNLPKPCVFFLEGNCRRSDCKYSHDLSNITCKYWIEGFCFKGEMCPFLHSYNPNSDSSLSESDGLSLLTKKELNPTFIIESEADFPSLPLDAPAPALNDSTKSSINPDATVTDLKHQILSSNSAVLFKTVKKKRKRG